MRFDIFDILFSFMPIKLNNTIPSNAKVTEITDEDEEFTPINKLRIHEDHNKSAEQINKKILLDKLDYDILDSNEINKTDTIIKIIITVTIVIVIVLLITINSKSKNKFVDDNFFI